ncbi:hypothetical protein CBM2592_A250046 [Cupriavidus taiwanensis]|nr:hypothetical protein CBM2592_A250046 [Cupriavidus taiwanensis]SOY51454.1 hypothetical protein CBM2588_A200046 [Cupriavidus taiwanensis]SOY84028.1 hypothetical protein CBM2591_A290046 [Cupriavidus taiwanensis]SOZ23768.1 hypothetical protein CBM2608_A290069 [Cupriavidus taiwanensis]SOZ58343.1 hypothetical protein CBM2617_A290047 [Cupriavidus taiwanensis]
MPLIGASPHHALRGYARLVRNPELLKQDKGLGPNGERNVVCYSTSQLRRKFDAREMETIRRFSRAVTNNSYSGDQRA